jgi:hypothetical protein
MRSITTLLREFCFLGSQTKRPLVNLRPDPPTLDPVQVSLRPHDLRGTSDHLSGNREREEEKTGDKDLPLPNEIKFLSLSNDSTGLICQRWLTTRRK